MLHLKLKEKQNEEGFTLIELLVVVIIIGILAAIAIPVFLNQRENAQRNSLQSSVQAAVTQIETEYTGNEAASYLIAATGQGVTDYDGAGFAGTPPVQDLGDVTLTFEQSGDGYCVQGIDTRLGAAPADDENSYHQWMQPGSGLASIDTGPCS